MKTFDVARTSRRRFLRDGALVTLAFAGLRKAFEYSTGAAEIAEPTLEADPAGILDLPSGFSYQAFSKTGERMDDGLLVPGKHDGNTLFVNILDPGLTLAVVGPWGRLGRA